MVNANNNNDRNENAWVEWNEQVVAEWANAPVVGMVEIVEEPIIIEVPAEMSPEEFEAWFDRMVEQYGI